MESIYGNSLEAFEAIKNKVFFGCVKEIRLIPIFSTHKGVVFREGIQGKENIYYCSYTTLKTPFECEQLKEVKQQNERR